MKKFKVINGGLSEEKNIFSDMTVSSCKATNTRLMGVVALHIIWDNRGNEFHQLFHLDYSEYGIDGYYESHNSDDIKGEWLHMSSGLGGNEISVEIEDCLGLIYQSLDINLLHRKNHDSELIEFQHSCEKIYNNMLVAIGKPPSKAPVFMAKVCKAMENSYESINYFIMRIYDHDYFACKHLSGLNEDYLDNLFYTCDMTGSLIRNKIDKINDSDYRCNALILSDGGYYYIDLSLSLDQSNRIIKYGLNHRQKISDVEAAFYTKQREYITLFRIKSPMDEFDLSKCSLVISLDYKVKENGLLHVTYNENNNHVMHKNYFMNGDVYGTYFITKSMQLLLMSHKIINISKMENDVLTSPLKNDVELVDRYQFENQVLESFMNYYDPDFENFIYNPDTEM